MPKLTLEKVLRGIIFGCAGLCLLVPLLVIDNFFVPFIFGKALVFRVLVEIMAVCYLTLLISDYKKYRPTMSVLAVLTSIFGLVFILATIFSVDRSVSFWGTIQRMEGLFSFLHYWVFFLILATVFKKENHWHHLFNLSIFISFLICVYSVIQTLRWDLVTMGEEIIRAVGTIGNPAFLAAYLLLNCSLILIMLLKTRQKWLKLFYWLALILNLAVIYLTNTRGALLAVLVGFFLLAFLYTVNFRNSRVVKYLWLGIILIAVAGTIIGVNHNQPWVKNNEYLQRLVDYSLKPTGTIQTRLMAWQIGWQGFQERPLLGWGPENYNLVFDKYFKPEFLASFTYEVWYDRAHNTVVDLTTTMGLAGLLSYLAIFVYALIKLGQFWRRTDDRAMKLATIILAVVMIAYFVQDLFIFDTVNSFIIFFLILAYINFVLTKPAPVETTDLRVSAAKKIKIWPLPFLLLAFIFLFIKTVSQPALANAQAATAKAYFENKLPVQGFELFKKSLSYGTFCDIQLRKYLADEITGVATNYSMSTSAKDFIVTAYQYTINELKKSLEQHPLDIVHYQNLGKNYALLAGFADEESNLQQAVYYFEKGLPLSPQRQAIRNELAFAKLRLGQKEEAIQILKGIIATNENIPEFHWNLFLAYEELKDNELAEQELAKATELNYPFAKKIEAVAHVIQFYLNNKQYDKALAWCWRAVEIEPNKASWYARLASLYAEMGDEDNARKMAQKVLELDPSQIANVEAFLNGLGK